MGSSLLEFQSVGGHGCNREAKVGDNVVGCAKMGCPDCEARRAVIQMMEAGVGSFEKARFVHWPGTTTEVVDEFTWEPRWPGGPNGIKTTRRVRDFFGNAPPAVDTPDTTETQHRLALDRALTRIAQLVVAMTAAGVAIPEASEDGAGP